MKKENRFVRSALVAAVKNDTIMPWTRGARRAAYVAKRNTEGKIPKAA
ncbi:MAG: hypothetical protein WBC93_04065 [Sulfitobacter sp.]